MSTPTDSTRRCIVCEQTADDVPLIPVEFRGGQFWICPAHLPILIHDPARLASRLPGAETLNPSERED